MRARARTRRQHALGPRPRALAVLAAATCVASCGASRAALPRPTAPLVATRDDPALAAPPGALPAWRLAVPPVQDIALSNGLQVRLVERHDVPLVTLRFVSRRAGEADATAEAGLASITAAMLARGTLARPAAVLATACADLGLDLSTETDRDASAVAVRAPSGELFAATTVLAEAVTMPAFAPGDLAQARERQLDERAFTVMSERRLPAQHAREMLFGGEHPLGRPLTGLGPAIRGRSRDALVAYHRERFAPADSAVIVVGDATRDAVAAQLERAFAGWQPAASGVVMVRAAAVEPPARRAPRLHLIDTGETIVARAHVALLWSGVPRGAADEPALRVLDALLGGTHGGRAHAAVRDGVGPARVVTSLTEFHRVGGTLGFEFDVPTGRAVAALRDVLAVVDRLRTARVGARELDAARAVARARQLDALATNDAAASALGALFAADLPAASLAELDARIEAVASTDVLRVAQRYLAPEVREIAIAGPRDELEDGLGSLGVGALEFFAMQ